MPRITLTFILLWLLSLENLAQLNFERTFDVTVIKNDNSLKRAWEGGLNNPIFSNINFDGNGETDLIAFDKTGNRLVLFKNNALEFEALKFNQNFTYGYDQNWILFRDYNCDGFPDIFAGEASSIRVYTNNGDFTFTEENLLNSDLGAITDNIFVPNSDVPGIVDIDGDSDLDILTFENSGVTVEWHKNISIEQSGSCGLTFEKQSGCWGRFEENALTSNITTNITCPDYGGDKSKSGGKHAGSTITTLDQNKDGDIDLLIGDISTSSLTYLNNGGNQTFSNINTVMENFPNYDNPLNLYQFPYASYVAVNNNGKKDILVASNDENIGDNKNIWHYKNIGVLADTFTFQTDEFLVGEMLDFGSSAFPIFIDENQDGLMDILVGSKGINKNGIITGGLWLLRNDGTINAPSFNLIDDDYLGLSSSGEKYFYPAVGDLDEDGDEDLLLGLQNGKIIYMNNLAGPGNPCNFVNADGNFEFIDVGSTAAPVLFDLNEDGNIDLLIGHKDGALSYFENQANTGFDYSVEVENFGGVSTKDLAGGYFFGFSAPFVYESAGEINLLVGGESGKTHHYKNIGLDLVGNFLLDQEDYNGFWDGGFSKPLLGDLNNDDLPELIIGNAAGGLAYYQGIVSHSVNKPILQDELNYKIEGDLLQIIGTSTLSLKVLDVNGRVIKTSRSSTLPLPQSKGVYFIIAETPNNFISFKLLK